MAEFEAEIEVQLGIIYIHKTDHRNINPNKSQWTITREAERECFNKAHPDWLDQENYSWGLHFENGKVTYLGITKSSEPSKRELFLAKFEDSSKNHKWHGYPADPFRHNQDIPPEIITGIWLKESFFKAAEIRKLSRGQLWKL